MIACENKTNDLSSRKAAIQEISRFVTIASWSARDDTKLHMKDDNDNDVRETLCHSLCKGTNDSTKL